MYDSEADKQACKASQNYFYPDTDEFVEDQARVYKISVCLEQSKFTSLYPNDSYRYGNDGLGPV